VDIAAKVASLTPGEYHVATTIVTKPIRWDGPTVGHIGHDPHTTDQWVRSLSAPGLPGAPLRFRVTGGTP
jgi:hypothetical protein